MNRILSILALLLAAAGPLQAGDNTCNPSVVANPNSGDLIAGGPAVNFTVTIGLGDCPTTEQISYSGSISYLFGVGIGDNNGPCDTLVQGLLDAGNTSDEYQCGFMAAANAAAGETASVEASIQGSWIDPPAAETPTGGGTQIALFTVVRVTNLTVSKIGGGDVFGPAPFFHNISVANGGPSYATTIVLTDVTDTLPAGVTGPTYTPSVGTVINNVWTITELANGASASLVVDYTTTARAAGVVHDTATVTGNAENENSAVLEDDETSTVIPEIDIAVTSTESIDQVLAGWPGTGNLTYVVTATNNGPGAATGLALSASLTWPAGVTVDSVTPSVGSATNGWPTTWTIGNLASGADETLTIVLTVGTGAEEGTDVINLSANVSAVTGADSNLANDSTLQATSIVWARATFDVTKEYPTGDAGPVIATLQCSDASGNIGYVQQLGPTPVLLPVERFDASASCTVVESEVPAGYSEIERTEDCDVSPVADQGAYSCTLTNAQIRATFEVTKDFSDGNPSEVEVSINCFTGLPLEQSQFISETQSVNFVVTEYEPGELDCEITEAVPAGYSPTYGIEGNEGGVAGLISGGGGTGCFFEEVVTGQFACQVENAPDPVAVDITKEWVFEGSSSPSDIDTTYELTLFCDAEIIGGDQIGDAVDAPAGYEPDFCGLSFPVADSGQTLIGGGLWCKEFHYDGPATFTAQVIPDYPSSECEVIETVHDSAVEVDNDCGDLVISAGQGASCTITNTVFFEGIPTLNQYGVAILALLMLGVGLVGFRRIV